MLKFVGRKQIIKDICNSYQGYSLVFQEGTTKKSVTFFKLRRELKANFD